MQVCPIKRGALPHIILALSLTLAIDIGCVNPVRAQVAVPRSQEFHTASSGDNSLAGWANPAGLAVKPEASIMGEFRLDKPDSGNTRLGQYSLGFNSRGFSLIYQKDLFGTGVSGSTWRFSVANRFQTGSIGVSYTLYRGGGQSDSGFDIGLRYLAITGFDFGAVLRNVGRPVVRGDTLDLTAVGSISFIPIEGWRFSTEAAAADVPGQSGYDMAYRALARISLSDRLSLIGVANFNDNVSLRRLVFGFSVGRSGDQLNTFGSLNRGAGSSRIDAVSLSALSSRDFSRPRR